MTSLSAALFDRFASILRGVDETDIRADVTLGGRLTLKSEQGVSINYAPFDYIERDARLVIVGITPGAQQASNALREARRKLLAGSDNKEALKSAKVFASFSGPMRTNLIAMLDHIGLNRWLNVQTVGEIWNERSKSSHFTSALRYPVFVNGENYSGSPSMTTTPILRNLLFQCLAEEAEALPNAVWVPLGPKATEGVDAMVRNGLLSAKQVLSGLPHPSGANAERIAYFLGRKERAMLSRKTSPDSLDTARTFLTTQVLALPS